MSMWCRRVLLIALVVHLVPAAAWAAYKPTRVLLPELLGLHCTASDVCVDDHSRIDEATALRKNAVEFVNRYVGRIEAAPRIVFCATEKCAKSFGFTSQGAYNVGVYGAVISPRGWRPHYLRHELIHHLQNERLGSVNAWLFKPKWFVEGMAYSLSLDPRRPLPEQLEGWRVRFERWYAVVGRDHVWREAVRLN